MEDSPSPERFIRDDITPPRLSPNYSPELLPEPDILTAATVAQEVSRLLMPMFDKRLETLHTSINSALTQITTNAEKIVDLENRVASHEITVANLEQTLTQHRESERLLHEKIEDLENRSRRNNLRFIGVPESVMGADLLTFLTEHLPKALAMDGPPDPHAIERAHRIDPQRPPGEANRRPRPVINI